MAVLSSAISSPRCLYAGVATTTNTTVYTAPSKNTNVTSPSATAYIKEIVVCNYSASPVFIYIQVNGMVILSGLTINAYDTKIITGLNTMLNAGSLLLEWAGTASSLAVSISGVEVQ